MINVVSTTPCFELVYSDGVPVDTGDGIPHYPDHTSASEDAPRYRTNDDLCIVDEAPTPRQLDVACVTISCGECGEPAWGEPYHFFPGQVDAVIKDSAWRRQGDHTLCPACAAADLSGPAAGHASQ